MIRRLNHLLEHGIIVTPHQKQADVFGRCPTHIGVVAPVEYDTLPPRNQLLTNLRPLRRRRHFQVCTVPTFAPSFQIRRPSFWIVHHSAILRPTVFSTCLDVGIVPRPCLCVRAFAHSGPLASIPEIIGVLLSTKRIGENVVAILALSGLLLFRRHFAHAIETMFPGTFDLSWRPFAFRFHSSALHLHRPQSKLPHAGSAGEQ